MRAYFNKFFALESASGILLLLVTLCAIAVENSAAREIYHAFLHSHLDFTSSLFSFHTTVAHAINDGLMVIFFLLVGLEIKRELVVGELSSRSQAILPAFAALGGMVAPALIYIYINRDSPQGLKGWAIPAATDIAFALGVLSLLGKRVPVSLKVFLTALAIIDDMGAVAIIAFFYTPSLNLNMFGGALLTLVGLGIVNKCGVRKLSPFLCLGFVLWLFILKSGIHATIAGVLLAATIPLKSNNGESPLLRLEKLLHPFVAFGIMPLFAFANAGLNFGDLSFRQILDPVPLGICAGLVIGKQLGVFFMTFLVVKMGLSKIPQEATWGQVYGVSILAGIGFTMSLFVGGLSFTDPALLAETRLGVIVGSSVSALMGLLLLAICTSTKKS